MKEFDPNNPIFLKTGDELTPEEQIKILQHAIEAMSQITKAQAILEDIESRRKIHINGLRNKSLRF